jgi:putative endonuclease
LRPPRPNQRSSTAEAAEDLVAALLARQGWRLLARNFRHIGCELDIVVQKGGTVVVVEVKARRHAPRCERELAALLPAAKRGALMTGAARFVEQHGLHFATLRFDLALVVGVAPASHVVRYFVQAF